MDYTTILFEEFDVGSEEELYELLVKDSLTIPCIICHRELTAEQINTIGDDPYCKDCV